MAIQRVATVGDVEWGHNWATVTARGRAFQLTLRVLEDNTGQDGQDLPGGHTHHGGAGARLARLLRACGARSIEKPGVWCSGRGGKLLQRQRVTRGLWPDCG